MKQLLAFIALLALSLFGCSTGPSAGNEATGSIGSAVTISGSITLSTLSYSISNGTGPVYTGSVDVLGQTFATFTQGGIIVGAGYVVTLTGTDSAGFACAGASAALTVSADTTTSCTVQLVCGAEAGVIASDAATGAISVSVVTSIDGGASYCSSLGGFTISNTDLPIESTVHDGSLFFLAETGNAPVNYSFAPLADGGLDNCTPSVSCLNCWGNASNWPDAYIYFAGPGGNASLACSGWYVLTASISQGAGDPCNTAPNQTATLTVYADPNATLHTL